MKSPKSIAPMQYDIPAMDRQWKMSTIFKRS